MHRKFKQSLSPFLDTTANCCYTFYASIFRISPENLLEAVSRVCVMGLEEGVLTHFAGTYPTCTCNPLPLLNKELARGWNAWFAPGAPAVRRTGFTPPDGGLTRRHTSKKS